MIAVSGAIVFAGYQLAAYGWSQLQGQNAGFFDLLWPGRYKGNTPDKGSATTTAGVTGSAALGSGPTSTSKTFPGGSTGATTILGK